MSDRLSYLTKLEDIARDCGLDSEIEAAVYVVDGNLAVESDLLEFCKRYLQGSEFYGF